MGVLQDRIKQLRGKQQAEQSLRMRPALPQNVLMMDEVESGELPAGAIDLGCDFVQMASELACTSTYPPTLAEQACSHLLMDSCSHPV